jgi:Peptidase dimerisation domain
LLLFWHLSCVAAIHRELEHFLVLEGVLTIGWAWDEEVIEARLGPKDMVLNQVSRPHGFRNGGIEPVPMSISVGSGMPKPPVYSCHPRYRDPSVARRFGATSGRLTPSIPPATIRASRSLIKGRGGHAAMPHLAIDPIIAAAQVVNGLQTIASRNVHPLEGAVASVTQIQNHSVGSTRHPCLAFPAKAGIHFCRGHRLSPV